MSAAGAGERGAAVRLPPPLVFLVCTLLGVALHHAVAPIALPIDQRLGAAAGVLLICLGLTLGIAANVQFSRTGQHPSPWKPSPELILAGPYRRLRNPMYVGFTLCQIGIGLAAGNLWIVLLALPALGVVHHSAVLPEEQYLTERFGVPYVAYLARVRRYL
jgi:protein-S-isoprenylcysteine O-methyltransferase Ste14